MIAPYYALMFAKMERIVWRFGWALTLHGTMARDLDLVLIPWTEDAEHEDKVVDAIRLFVEGKYVQSLRRKDEKKRGVNGFSGVAAFHVTQKPHGRRAISIYIGPSGYYLDISIMPRTTEAREPDGPWHTEPPPEDGLYLVEIGGVEFSSPSPWYETAFWCKRDGWVLPKCVKGKPVLGWMGIPRHQGEPV